MADDTVDNAGISFKTRLLWMLTISPAVLVFDYATKRIVLDKMTAYGPPIELIPNIARLRFIYNDGIVFGISPSFFSVSTLAAISVIVALLMIAYLLFARIDDRLMLTAMCLVVGGACGNLVDRLQLGQVIDFIEVGIGDVTWPVFNVADAAVTVGAVLLAWRLLRPHHVAEKPVASDSGSAPGNT